MSIWLKYVLLICILSPGVSFAKKVTSKYVLKNDTIIDNQSITIKDSNQIFIQNSILKQRLLPTKRDYEILIKRYNSINFFNNIKETPNLTTISPFLNYYHNIDPIYQKKPFPLDVDIQPHFFIGGKPSWRGIVVDFETRVKIRLFLNDISTLDNSRPVRTPSYIPAVKIYKSLHFDTSCINGDFLYLKGYHHSNGQDQKPYFDGDIVQTILTRFPLGFVFPFPPGSPNIYNGDFADNFVTRFGYGFITNIHDWDSLVYVKKRSFKYYGNIDFEYHWWLSEQLNKYNLYSKNRINLSLGCIKRQILRENIVDVEQRDTLYLTRPYLFERWRIYLQATIMADRYLKEGTKISHTEVQGIAKRINISVTYAWHLKGGATYLFSEGGYYGSDPYNIYYQQSKFFIRAGLGLGIQRYEAPSNFISGKSL
ncbi:MAG: hypothetical protein SGJ04_02105 [Bacteroidota bacterium]|nr:hypothetical protein [Bacteroidota bacterium]